MRLYNVISYRRLIFKYQFICKCEFKDFITGLILGRVCVYEIDRPDVGVWLRGHELCIWFLLSPIDFP